MHFFFYEKYFLGYIIEIYNTASLAYTISIDFHMKFFE